MKAHILEEIDFTLEVPAVSYKKTITLVVKQKSIVQELHDDIIVKLKPTKYTGNERKYVEGALKHIDFLVDENVIFFKEVGFWDGFYDGKINVRNDDDMPRDDIKITIFHEYLHHINYMEKIYPYRYSDENIRKIFQIEDDCYIFRESEMDDVFLDYLKENNQLLSDEKWDKQQYEELGVEEKEILLNYKNKNMNKYGEQCFEGIYKPSNYYRDEIAVYSICLQENHNLFIFSNKKENMAYRPNLSRYYKILKTSDNYEKSKNYNEEGFEIK